MNVDVKKVAEKLELNHEWVLQNYKDLYEKSTDESFKKKVNDEVADILETKSSDQPHRSFGRVAAYQALGSGHELDERDYKSPPKQIEEAKVDEEEDEQS